MKVYLAGPITGLGYTAADTWRSVVEEILRDNDITALSPLRTGPAEFNGPDGERVTAETLDIGPMFTDRGIMTRDHWDVARCDAVLFNLLGVKSVSIGTVMELAWAYAYRKPTVVVMERDGNLHDHPMVREATDYRCDNLTEAVEQLTILREA